MGCCESPSKLQMASAFAKSVAGAVKKVSKLEKVRLGSQGQQVRLAICMKCSQYDKAKVRCRKCGCFLKMKVILAAEKCPLGYW